MAIQYPEKVQGGDFYLGEGLAMKTITITDLETGETKTFKALDLADNNEIKKDW